MDTTTGAVKILRDLRAIKLAFVGTRIVGMVMAGMAVMIVVVVTLVVMFVLVMVVRAKVGRQILCPAAAISPVSLLPSQHFPPCICKISIIVICVVFAFVATMPLL